MVEKRDGDVSYTPPEVFAALLQVVPLPHCPLFWEPCAGSGSLLSPLAEYGSVVATEIDPGAPSVVSGAAYHYDALQGVWPGFEPNVCLTNPPFTKATRFLRMLMAVPSMQVIGLLLLQGWVVPIGQGPERRVDLVWGPTARPERQMPVYPRIPFFGPDLTGTRADQREYAVVVWRRQRDGSWLHPGPTQLSRLTWEKRAKSR